MNEDELEQFVNDLIDLELRTSIVNDLIDKEAEYETEGTE